MELTTYYSIALYILVIVAALSALYISANVLRYRLRIDKKLAHYLAVELKEKNIDFGNIDINRSIVTVEFECSLESRNDLRGEIKTSLDIAVQKLLDDERELVIKSLNQSSERGKEHYFKKIVHNSVEELQCQS